jgi:hypothetical protein
MTDNQILEEQVSVAGPARLDREFTGRHRNTWLFQVAGKIRLALYRRIPVGFEDETGFHLGAQSTGADGRMNWERASIFADDNCF